MSKTSTKKKQTFFPTDALHLKERALQAEIASKPKTPLPLKALTPGHKVLLKKLGQDHHDILFAVGPAGTGKTYICVRKAIDKYLAGECQKIVITRPNVASGDDLGYLPGTLQEKMAPWTRPVVDVFMEYFSAAEFKRMMDTEEVEIAPLAYMRGRTFKNAIVIGDEMQNATPEQMKMFLTRIGANSRMYVTGDMEQWDRRELGGGVSGLLDIVNRMERKAAESAALPAFLTDNVVPIAHPTRHRWERMGIVRLGRADVVRHEVIEEVLDLYDDE